MRNRSPFVGFGSFVFAVAFSLLAACATPTSGVYFDEENADKVEIGMSEEMVEELLGTPYLVEPYIGGEKWIWAYSTRDLDTSFAITIENDEVTSISGYHENKR